MININNKATIKAKYIHKTELKEKVLKSKYFKKLPNYLKKFIINNIDEILVGSPQKISKINVKYYKIQQSKVNKRKYDSILKKLFSYSNFNQDKKEYNLHNLSENISIMYCPYCNRQPTINVKASSIKPDFDHFFPQSKYPLLGLSFCNLIPSCTTCNSRLKIGKVLRLNKYLHPYSNNSLYDYCFTYKYDINSNNLIRIDVKGVNFNPVPNEVKKSFELFKIIEIYNAHQDEIIDLIKIRQIYSNKYLKILSTNTYRGLKISQDELYRLAFGVYKDEKDFSKRPFSKLKKDILKELGII